MLPAHAVRGQDAVFRPRRNADAETAAFPASPLDGTTVGIRPDDRALARLKARHPGAAFGPLKPGPGRYTAGETVFAPGTTQTEGDGFAVADLAAIHRARWRVRERYRTARWFLAAGSFRAESGRGVLREPCASFVMVTATRLMTNGTGAGINGPPDDGHPERVSFRHAVAAVLRNFGVPAPARAEAVAETVSRTVDGIAAPWQRERPGRSCPGVSRKPRNRWSRKGKVAAAG